MSIIFNAPDYTFPSFGGTLRAEFDADLGITIDFRVSNWEDQGPYGFDLAQGNTSFQPLYVSSAAHFNNHNAVSSTDLNDRIGLDTSKIATLISPPNTGGLSVIAVAQSASTATEFQSLISNGDSSVGDLCWRLDLSNTSDVPQLGVRNAANDTTYSVEWTSDIRDGNGHILSAYYDVDNSEIGIRVDGADWVTNVATDHRSSSVLALTSSAFAGNGADLASGDLAYAGVWTDKHRRLTDTQFSTAEASLATTYGITLV